MLELALQNVTTDSLIHYLVSVRDVPLLAINFVFVCWFLFLVTDIRAASCHTVFVIFALCLRLDNELNQSVNNNHFISNEV